MELQVSTVPGMRDCFVALPLHAIDALQGRNRDDDIFSVTLELRYPKSSNLSDRFYLSWAGASSLSSSIEVSSSSSSSFYQNLSFIYLDSPLSLSLSISRFFLDFLYFLKLFYFLSCM